MPVSEEVVRCVIGHDPEVGVVEASTLPELSTATQRPVVGHEMPLRRTVPSIITAVQELWLAGVELETTLPWLSVAKHAVAVGHETPVSGVPASTLAEAHWVNGLVLVNRLLALLPTATQRAACGHDSDAGDTSPALTSCHPPAAGVVLVKTLPMLSTPMHSAAVGQLIAVGGFVSAPVGAVQVGAGSDATAGTAAQHSAAIAAAANIIRRPVRIVPIITTRSLSPLSLNP
jgi:hypothetical protein